jgi:LCP family protein required for cell wall assembly
MQDKLEKRATKDGEYVSKTDTFLEEMKESFAKQIEEQNRGNRFSEGLKDSESVGVFKSSGRYETYADENTKGKNRKKTGESVLEEKESKEKNNRKSTEEKIAEKENSKEKKVKEENKNENQAAVSDYINLNMEKPKKKKMPVFAKVLVAVFAILIVVGGTGAYYVNYVLGQATIVDAEEEDVYIPVEEETFDQDEKSEDAEEIDPEEVLWGKLKKLAKKEEDVINILLVGEEDLGEEENGRGRTDCMIIATISKKEKALKLTSLMRDMYVQIPGYSDNKLNAAYRNGGMSLLEETIELNFGVAVDGYVLVDFDAFEDVIDALGGVEIKLSEIEAKYLNTHNYISKKKYRTVKAGKQVLNGNQARGYTRIRYVKTANGLTDDWGRNYRQRKVLKAIFKKYKSKSAVELVAMLPDILKLVTTDLTKKDMMGYIGTVLTINAEKLETMSIPVKGSFSLPYINGMSVILPKLETNQVELHKFLFGEDEEESEG